MSTYKQDIQLWGHSLADYIEMFALTDDELKSNILDCNGGPGSFNIELTQKGGHAISNDPLFRLSVDELKQEIDSKFKDMLDRLNANQSRYIWDSIKSPKELAEKRQQQIESFLNDFPSGVREGRYQAHPIEQLPFEHMQFDLALCSHFLFANSPDQSAEYHVEAIAAMCHVASEVRIFPLLDSMGEIPKLVEPVMLALHQNDFGLEFKAVPYEFQKKGNAMLRVWAHTCEVKN